MQIIRIQNSPEAAVFRAQAREYANVLKTYYPDRGEIYDRNGHLLAGNKTVYEVGVELSYVKDKQAIALAVGAELGLNPDDLYNQMANAPAGQQYLILANYVAADKADQLKKLKDATDAKTAPGEYQQPVRARIHASSLNAAIRKARWPPTCSDLSATKVVVISG